MADGHGPRVPRPTNASRGTGSAPNHRPSDNPTRRGPDRPGGSRPPGAISRSAQSAASKSAPSALTILGTVSRTAATAGPTPGEGDADSRDPTSRKRPAATIDHWSEGCAPNPVAASATPAPSDAGAAPIAAAAAGGVDADATMDDEDGAAAAAPGPVPDNRPIVIQRHKKAKNAPPAPEDDRDAAGGGDPLALLPADAQDAKFAYERAEEISHARAGLERFGLVHEHKNT